MFERKAGMLELPNPIPGGSVSALREFINVTDEEFPLIVAWLVYALRGQGPFPVLVLQGEQGSAKSTTAKVLRSLIDPSIVSLRTIPKDERDLLVMASNSYVVSLDNLSYLSSTLSDALCRISSTGGGFSTRQLYTDKDEVLVSLCRPIIVNGIADIISRPDLLDRSIILQLPHIPDENRKADVKFWPRFEKKKAGIFGALLTLLSKTLNALPGTVLKSRPRMADFASLGAAMESTPSWNGEPFLKNYLDNIKQAVEIGIEGSMIESTLRDFIMGAGSWSGNMTELLTILDEKAPDKISKSKAWP
jgi:hypothetical protein